MAKMATFQIRSPSWRTRIPEAVERMLAKARTGK